MKTVFSFVVLLLSSIGFAQNISFGVDAPQYKGGTRCEGNLEGAKVIDIMEKSDGNYDLILSGGGVTTGTFSLEKTAVRASSNGLVVRSKVPQVAIIADYAAKKSHIQIQITPTGIGFGSAIAINANSYVCYPLFVAQ